MAWGFPKGEKVMTLYINCIETLKNTSKISEESDIGEVIRLKLLSNKNALITIVVLFSLILSAVLISMLLSSFKTVEPQIDTASKTIIKSLRLSPLDLPDNFTLMLSEHSGIIINWQADTTNEIELWDIHKAQGDKNCQEIVFNDGEKIRTINVMVEGGNDYFANFSPLDTKALLQSIAFRGNFSLCGYKFSLKGSQAALGKHSDYADIIDY